MIIRQSDCMATSYNNNKLHDYTMYYSSIQYTHTHKHRSINRPLMHSG